MKIQISISLLAIFSCSIINPVSAVLEKSVDGKKLPIVWGAEHGRDCVERLWRAQGLFKQSISLSFPKKESLIEKWGGINFEQTSKPTTRSILEAIESIVK